MVCNIILIIGIILGGFWGGWIGGFFGFIIGIIIGFIVGFIGNVISDNADDEGKYDLVISIISFLGLVVGGWIEDSVIGIGIGSTVGFLSGIILSFTISSSSNQSSRNDGSINCRLYGGECDCGSWCEVYNDYEEEDDQYDDYD